MKKKELKSSKSSAKKNKSLPERFLLKRGDNYFIVNKIALDSFSFQELLSIADNTYHALKRQLYLDAVHGDHFIQEMKVIEALQHGLDVLYSKHPVLRDYVKDQENFKSIKENLA